MAHLPFTLQPFHLGSSYLKLSLLLFLSLFVESRHQLLVHRLLLHARVELVLQGMRTRWKNRLRVNMYVAKEFVRRWFAIETAN